MAREEREKVIDDTLYYVVQMDGVRALKTQTKLLKILGSSLLKAKTIKNITAEEILNLLTPVLDNLEDEELNKLIILLFETGIRKEVNGAKSKVTLDTEFIGNPFKMWQVIAFIIEVNFSLGELLKSTSPTTKEAEEKIQES